MILARIGVARVGGYFGARLARGGANVVFVARGAHFEAMRKHGLRIEKEHEPIELPKVDATDDPSSIGRVDHFGTRNPQQNPYFPRSDPTPA